MKKYLDIIAVLITDKQYSLCGRQNYSNSTTKLGKWQYIAYHLGAKLDKQFGKSIDYVAIEGDPMRVGLNKDNGKIDVFPDLWMPNQEQNWSNCRGAKIGKPTSSNICKALIKLSKYF